MKRFTLSVLMLALFAFMANAQQISKISPDTAYQGQSFWMTIEGSSTHFTGINSSSSIMLRRGFGSTINPDSFTIVSDVLLKAKFSIPTNSPLGLYEIRVTTSTDGQIRLRNAFELLVNPKAPKLISINPDTAMQGDTLTISVTCQFTHFTQGSQNVGIQYSNQFVQYASSYTVKNDSFLTAHFSIPNNAPVGQYYFFVINNTDGTVYETNIFTVLNNPNKPLVTSVSPKSVQQGNTLALTIKGTRTHFLNNSNQIISLYRGTNSMIMADSFTASNDSQMTAWFNVTFASSVGNYTLSIDNDVDGIMTLSNAVQVTTSPYQPKLISVSPSQGGQGDAVVITIRGKYTHFTDPFGTNVVLQQGNQTIIPADSVLAKNDSVCMAYFSIPVSSPLGQYDVTVVNNTDGQMSLGRSFEIIVGKNSPKIISLNPDYAYPEDTIMVLITCQNTSFLIASNITANLRMNWTNNFNADSVQAVNDTLLKAWFHFPANASLGLYNLTVSGSSVGNLTKDQAFELKISPTAPQIVSFTPVKGTQGTKVSMTIDFLNTSLTKESGLNAYLYYNQQNYFAATTLSTKDDTTLLANFDIPMTTPVGVYYVLVTGISTGQIYLLGFEVEASPYIPRLASIDPYKAQQGDLLKIKIEGKYTHFTQGSNQSAQLRLMFNTINSTSVHIINDTQMTANFDIPFNAQPGKYDFNLIGVIDGNLSLPESFEISPAPSSPQIASIEPTYGYLGDKVTITMHLQNIDITKSSNLSSRLNMGFGNMIWGQNLKIINDSTLTADFSISQNATPGYYDLELRNTTEGTLMLTESFEVRLPATSKQVVSITPAKSQVGSNVHFIISCVKTNFKTEKPVVSLSQRWGSQINADNVIVVNDTALAGSITIPSTANTGKYDVDVSSKTDGSLTLNAGFEVVFYEVNPQIKSIDNDSFQIGESNSVKVFATQTAFTKAKNIDAWIAKNGETSVYKLSSSVVNDSIISFTFDIPQNTSLGTWSLFMFDNIDDTLSLTDALTVWDKNNSTPEFNPVVAKVYPNPASNQFSLSIPNASHLDQIIIRDISGRIIQQSETVLPYMQYDCSQWPKGIYAIELISNNLRSSLFVEIK